MLKSKGELELTVGDVTMLSGVRLVFKGYRVVSGEKEALIFSTASPGGFMPYDEHDIRQIRSDGADEDGVCGVGDVGFAIRKRRIWTIL